MKYCPRCGYTTENEQDNFCPVCVDVDEPVRLVEKPVETEITETPVMAQPKSAVETVVSSVTSQVATSVSGSSLGAPDISLGRANAIAGDVKVETHSTVGDITVVNEKKTLAEELADKKRAFRTECKKYCVDGFVSDTGLGKLDECRYALDLDKDIANEILNEVKILSKKVRTELPPAGRVKLEYAVAAIERNDERAIATSIVDLESWMNRVQVDELNQMYYQLYAIVYPVKYLDILKNDTREDYWKTFWSFVAYNLQGLRGEAEAALAELTAWDSFYPQQNQNLLSVVGYLMYNEESAAREAYSHLAAGYSKDLELLRNTLQSLLDTDWTQLAAKVPPRYQFYAKSLFGTFTKGLESKQQEAAVIQENLRAKQLEEEARQRAEAEKLQYQKESFVLNYTESDGNVDKACQAVGITNATFNGWLSQDRAFSDSFNDAQRRVEARKEEERQSLAEKKMRDEENNRLKLEFARVYELNNCDLLRTCAETGVASATFRDWMDRDQTFADKIKYTKRVYDEKVKELEAIKRRAKFKKALPVILIIALLAIIAGCIYTYRQRAAEERAAAEAAEVARQELIEQQEIAVRQYENLIVSFNNALEATKGINVPSLVNAYNIFKSIQKMENDELLKGKSRTEDLRRAFVETADTLYLQLSKLVDHGRYIPESDREGRMKLAEEANNMDTVKFYRNLVSQ